MHVCTAVVAFKHGLGVLMVGRWGQEMTSNALGGNTACVLAMLLVIITFRYVHVETARGWRKQAQVLLSWFQPEFQGCVVGVGG